jgi:hypothetical protein
MQRILSEVQKVLRTIDSLMENEMKCNDCKWGIFPIQSVYEPEISDYCLCGHWEEIDYEDESDQWDDCEDFEEVIK